MTGRRYFKTLRQRLVVSIQVDVTVSVEGAAIARRLLLGTRYAC